MQVCHGGFGGGDEVAFAERLAIEPFLHGVGLIEEFGELPHALHALRLHHERRTDLGVTVFVDVEVEQELNHRPLQSCAPAGVEQKAAACQFRAALEINELQRIAQIQMALGLKIKRDFVARYSYLLISAFVADGHAFVGEIREGENQIIERIISLGPLCVKQINFVAQLTRFCFLGLGFVLFPLAHQRADLLGNRVAGRLQSFRFSDQRPSLFVQRQ